MNIMQMRRGMGTPMEGEAYETISCLYTDGYAYIDTDLVLSSCKFDATLTWPSTAFSNICGGHYWSQSTNWYPTTLCAQSRNPYTTCALIARSGFLNITNMVAGNKYRIILASGEQKVYNSSGSLLGSASNSCNASTVTAIIFGSRNLYDESVWRAGGKYGMESVKVYGANNVTRDYIPCKLLRSVVGYNGKTYPSGTFGMWDLNSDKFFGNDNDTGDFYDELPS